MTALHSALEMSWQDLCITLWGHVEFRRHCIWQEFASTLGVSICSHVSFSFGDRFATFTGDVMAGSVYYVMVDL